MSTAIDEGEQEISDGVFEIFGQKLESFSFDRQAAAQRLGDDSGAENDVLLVYLCLTPIADVRRLRTDARVEAFREKMGQWADEHKVTIHKASKGRQEIAAIANRMFADLEKSDFAPAIEGTKKAPDPNATG